MDLLSLIGGKTALIGAGVVAILTTLAAMFRVAFKAGKDSQLAKEGQANAKTIKAIAKANAAAAAANVDKLHDDGFRRD